MKKYGKITFDDSTKLINYFNGVEGSNKELISVCACDFTFVAFYRNKEEYIDVVV